METSRQSRRAHSSRPGFVTGPGASVAWLVLALFLLVALIQIAMHFNRLSTGAMAQLLLVPVVIAGVVGLVCWLLGRAIFYRNTIAGSIGFSVVLLLATVMRVLIMAGVFAGSMRGGNFRVNTPGPTASNTPGPTTPPARPNRPAPVMPNPVPPTAAPSTAAPGASPANPAPGANPFPGPPSTGPAHDFAAVAEQVAANAPEARDILVRHARELQSLVDGFSGPAETFLTVLDGPPSIDPTVLRQRVAAVQSLKDAGTRYTTAARSLRERLEADLRAEPRVDKSAVPSISGRFLAMSSATGRLFAIEQVIRAGDDLAQQSQLVLDSPTSWSIDARGNVTTSDASKASEYRLYETKLMAPKRMLRHAVDRAVSP